MVLIQDRKTSALHGRSTAWLQHRCTSL